jgi:hypothetical protein
MTQGHSPSLLIFNIDLEFLARAIRQEEEIQIRKGEVKLSLSADDRTLYLKNSKNSTKNFNIINTFSKVAGYKINMQNRKLFCRTTINRLGKNLGKKIPFQ